MTWQPTSRHLPATQAPATAKAGTAEALLTSLKPVEGAFIQNLKGDRWGSEADLLLAHLIFGHLKRSASKTRVKAPKWDIWANELRLMREAGMGTDEATSRFEAACADAKWSRRILSPSQLRRHWGALAALQPKKEGASDQVSA